MAPQLVEKVVYVDMKALEEEAAVSCWRSVGARTDRQHELIRDCAWRLVALATLNLLDLNAQRTRERTRARRRTFSFTHNARACHSHHTPPHSAYKAASPCASATRTEVSGQAQGTEWQPRLARARKTSVVGGLCGVQRHLFRRRLMALPAGEGPGTPVLGPRLGRGNLQQNGWPSGLKLGRFERPERI